MSALLDAGFAEQSGAAGALKAGLGAVKGAGGTERRETKDRFVRFHEALEEVEAVHQQARFEEGEQELRERLKGEVERMVVPTYAKFVQKHRKDNCAFSFSLYFPLSWRGRKLMLTGSTRCRLDEVRPPRR